MVKEAKEGDVLLFLLSGHRVEADMKPGQKDDAIVPCDLNLIYDVDIRLLIQQLPKETSFTIVSDSCHSGGLIVKEKEQIGPHSTLRSIAPSVDAQKRGISLESIHQGHLLTPSSQRHKRRIRRIGTTVAFSTGLDIVSNIGHLLTGIFRDNVSLKFQPSQEPRSLTEDEGILLSGCQADELSLDLEPSDKTQGKADKNAGTAFLATIPTPLALPMINKLVHKKKAVLVGCSLAMPTGIKIKAALYKMVHTARPGDVLFFYFSGHGIAVPVLKPANLSDWMKL
ncbi:metacaspase-9-like [Gossypium hirsutum]|uniref:Metacaspase-9-like n=1 Tax=Gossypium hirsutum TaxID=3635 RepID=A0ABM3A9N3_GOSHI|nr:metacaspase-9-like [Gossypium hirsutum]